MGKIWNWKILANLTNGAWVVKFFLTTIYTYIEITKDLLADLPKFSKPFASSVMIYLTLQNFPRTVL